MMLSDYEIAKKYYHNTKEYMKALYDYQHPETYEGDYEELRHEMTVMNDLIEGKSLPFPDPPQIIHFDPEKKR